MRPAGVSWIGNASELCAGYAADGYARAGLVQDGPSHLRPRVGALLTTYGVGELSAMNAVAGSFAERVPVVHLVGSPSRSVWRERRLIHHSPGDERLDIYATMAAQTTCAQANLYQAIDGDAAASMYDSVLQRCVAECRPGYVQIPSDMFEVPADASPLQEELHLQRPLDDPSVETRVIDHIIRRLRIAKKPLVIADGLAYSFDMSREINELLQLTGISAVSFTSGKGIVDEQSSRWSATIAQPTDLIATSDLVLIFGPLLSDTNTAGWGILPNPTCTVSFNLDSVQLEDGTLHRLDSKQLLRWLLDALKQANLRPDASPSRAIIETEQSNSTVRTPGALTQDVLWPRMASFLRSDDCALFANGTPLIGSRDMKLPSNCQVFSSGLWNSIGQMLPAAQGISLAKRDLNLPGRTVLFEGDGSFQVTCQSLSDIIRYKLDVTIFITNNSGYTYEIWLHGMHAEYNDVPAWRYTEAPSFFGARMDDPDYPVLTKTIRSVLQLDETLDSENMADAKGLKLIEVILHPEDVPKKAEAGLIKGSLALRSQSST